MDFSELLVKRRSVRDFAEGQVPLDTIQGILRDTCLAPSSGNGQPWRFVIIQKKDLIRRLSDESKKNLVSGIEQNPDSPLKKYEAALRDRSFNVFYNAPTLVYLGCPRGLISAPVDGALGACYFMLAAANRNLGTCWVALGSDIRDPGIRREVGMDPDFQIIAPIILGTPRAIPAPSPRNEPQIVKII